MQTGYYLALLDNRKKVYIHVTGWNKTNIKQTIIEEYSCRKVRFFYLEYWLAKSLGLTQKCECKFIGDE